MRVAIFLLVAAMEMTKAVPRRAQGRDPNVEEREVVFSGQAESILREKQGETLETLSQLVGKAAIVDVERKCVELGLRCGKRALSQSKPVEKWRVSSKRREQ